jgi:DNA polymerase III subunit delta'
VSETAGVWADLVGQQPTVEMLRSAVAAAERALGGDPSAGMTHAWLFTGPPGSGRSNAARAFAAALLCDAGGCGRCLSCRTALAGSHSDVTLVRTTELSIRVGDVRELVRRAAMAPTGRRWQVLVVEDADRLTEQAADALLKALEEPAARTVWLLCAPTVEDVVVTIRSRARLLVLRTPSPRAVAEVLEREGVDDALAVYAARTSLGHIGRARALARDEATRNRRREVLTVPARLLDLVSCLNAAANLVELAAEEAAPVTARIDAEERAELDQVLGGGKSVKGRAGAAAKELGERQKTRAKRAQRDFLDRALVDLLSYYRDVLILQSAASVALVNEELRPELMTMASRTSEETSLGRIEAIMACRQAVAASVPPLLAAEAMMIALRSSDAGSNRT